MVFKLISHIQGIVTLKFACTHTYTYISNLVSHSTVHTYTYIYIHVHTHQIVSHTIGSSHRAYIYIYIYIYIYTCTYTSNWVSRPKEHSP